MSRQSVVIDWIIILFAVYFLFIFLSFPGFMLGIAGVVVLVYQRYKNPSSENNEEQAPLDGDLAKKPFTGRKLAIALAVLAIGIFLSGIARNIIILFYSDDVVFLYQHVAVNWRFGLFNYYPNIIGLIVSSMLRTLLMIVLFALIYFISRVWGSKDSFANFVRDSYLWILAAFVVIEISQTVISLGMIDDFMTRYQGLITFDATQLTTSGQSGAVWYDIIDLYASLPFLFWLMWIVRMSAIVGERCAIHPVSVFFRLTFLLILIYQPLNLAMMANDPTGYVFMFFCSGLAIGVGAVSIYFRPES